MQIQIGERTWSIPDGFTSKKGKWCTLYCSPNGKTYELHAVGYQEINDGPYLKEQTLMPGGEKIPLKPVDSDVNAGVKKGLAWKITLEILATLKGSDGKLLADYEQRLESIRQKLGEHKDQNLAQWIMTRLERTITRYEQTRVWDMTLSLPDLREEV